MFRKVKLYGKLAEFVGHNELKVKVDSVAKAVSFVIVGVTPKDLQAISSSLKASQALPTGSFLIFSVK